MRAFIVLIAVSVLLGCSPASFDSSDDQPYVPPAPIERLEPVWLGDSEPGASDRLLTVWQHAPTNSDFLVANPDQLSAPASLLIYGGSRPPQGFVDGVGRHVVQGWTCIDDYGEPMWVHFYDGSTYMGSTVANDERGDVGWICGGYTRRGFHWPIPLMGGVHQINVYTSDSPTPSTAFKLPGASWVDFAYPLTGDHPIGYVESMNRTSITGWACDRNAPGTPIDLHAYYQKDGVGPPVFLAGSTTTGFRGDLVGICGSGWNTAFTITLPATLRGGFNNVWVYGINVGPGINNALNESPGVPNLVDFGCVAADGSNDSADNLQAVLNSGVDLVLCENQTYRLKSRQCQREPGNSKLSICYTTHGQRVVTRGLPRANEITSSAATLQVDAANVLGALEAYNLNDIGLRGVLLEGSRNALGVTWAQYQDFSALVRLKGTTAVSGHIVEYNKLRNTRGWSTLEAGKDLQGSCSRFEVAYNRIEGAGCSLAGEGCRAGDPPGTWADGISFSCRDSKVYGNTILDATDGAIVLFAPPNTEVFSNGIFAISRTLFGGINLVDDTTATVNLGGVTYADYRNVIVRNNHINAAFFPIDIGIAQGGHTWFCHNTLPATGAVVNNNTFQGPYFHWGAVLDNVHNWTFTGNTFPGSFSGPSVSSICTGAGQIGGGTIPSPSRKCAKNHITGSSNIQSTCGALAGGESLHEVLLSN
jgi:hypothetical protein